MKKFITRLQAWYKAMRDEMRKKRRERYLMCLQQDAEERIQVREYRGDIYLCLDDIPLLGEDDVVESMGNALETMRSMYVEYHNRRS